MLTIQPISGGGGYFEKYLSQQQDSYYSEHERVQGQWHGRGAARLGLDGEVSSEDFERLREARDPASGEFLRQRQSADRIAADGTTQGRARNLYDFTISAPKSVSIMSALGGDRRLLEAHKAAVAETLQELETLAASRVRLGGANEDRATGNLALAVYHHDTSRALDPQLHTHAVAANLTFDEVESRWKALQPAAIYDSHHYLTEVYRNALAREVHRLGYEIRDRFDERGRNLGFELAGVPDTLIDKFSQRAGDRDAAIETFIERNGRRPTNNEIAILVRESRADKQDLPAGEIERIQRARLTPDEGRGLRQYARDALQPVVPAARRDPMAYARDHVFERVSVAHQRELLTEALRHGRGQANLPNLKAGLDAPGILRSGDRLTTVSTLDRERDMVAAIDRGIGRFAPMNDRFLASDRLRPEQKRAVEAALSSRDFAVNICGAAGTGKTSLLEDLRRGIEESGRQAVAVAPTMSAVNELQQVGFRDAATLQSLLPSERVPPGAVLILDETGMVSARQMADLLRTAERQGARIVFSGDTGQLQSVEAGDALRILERESRLKTVVLTEVQRQTVPEYRAAVEDLRSDPRRGFERLERLGAIREVEPEDRAATVAQLRREAAERGGTVLVVCSTHEEIGCVTEAIRAGRQAAGELGPDTRLERLVPLSWTAAQKAEPQNYRSGLVFVRGTRTIEGARARRLTPTQAAKYEVFEPRPIDLAPGDRIVLTANRRSPGFQATNGELATVAAIDRGRIQLEDGRSLPPDYRHFDYGYALTAHRAQGKGVDSVVISADAMSKELFYVAASRGRRSIAVVTTDADRLRASIGRSGARTSASELVREMDPTRAINPPSKEYGHEHKTQPRPEYAREHRTYSIPAR